MKTRAAFLGRDVQLMESLRMSETVQRCLHGPFETEKARKKKRESRVGSSNDKQPTTVTNHVKTGGPRRHKSMQTLPPFVHSHMRVPEPSIGVLEVSHKPVASNPVLSTLNQCARMKHHLLHDSCDRPGHMVLKQLEKTAVQAAAS
mmetsp:Transcript_582/g.2116  ORF Transcript_582/g.2116 Transcript_582/m.2116 type:complete len:146 (-) Transcript_582:597-1034(-)